MLSERAGHTAETDRAVRQGIQRVEQVSAAWSKGHQVHTRRRDLKLSVRIRVLKAVVKGVLFSFVRTRSWQTSQVNRLQSVINLAVRRALNVRTYNLRRCGLSNAILCRMVQWEPFLTSARRASLLWLAHVARMEFSAPQKQLLFGWLSEAGAKQHSPFKQAQWLNACLRDANISEIDWYRLAQNRARWQKVVHEAYPKEVVLLDRERELDAWRVGQPIPRWARNNQPQGERNYEDSDNELGERRRGGDQHMANFPRKSRARQGWGHTDLSSLSASIYQAQCISLPL